MVALGLALALLIGVTLGVLGGGGSTLAVPVLVYVLGYGAKQAIAMSLAMVGTTSLFGALSHWRSGRVRVRTALLFGAVAMAGSYTGARLSVLFSGPAQLALFGGVMLLAAGFMYRGRPEAASPASQHIGWRRAAWISLQGFGVGVLTGLVGVGGGFLIVPALVLLGGVPMKEAVGTSLLVIALNAAAGFTGYVTLVEIPWGFLGVFTGAAVVGILVGARLGRFFSHGQLRRAFALFLVVMGVWIVWQNRVVFGVAPVRPAPAEPLPRGSLEPSSAGLNPRPWPAPG